MDETTGQLFLKKTLTHYSPSVYAYLRDHRNPHVPAVHSFREENGRLIVLEEYVQGKTLDELLAAGTLKDTDKYSILTGLCDALTFLHSAPSPIIHRDIKPSNVMLTSDGFVKLIDYDAAKIHIPEKQKDTTLIGTPGSAAPEQYGFAQSDVRTDIYALGVLIQTLFPGDPRYERIALKATSIDPKDRYQSAQQVRRVLEKALHRSRRYPARIIAFCIILCILPGITIFIIKSLSGKAAGSLSASASEDAPVSAAETASQDMPEPVSETAAEAGSEALPEPDAAAGSEAPYSSMDPEKDPARMLIDAAAPDLYREYLKEEEKRNRTASENTGTQAIPASDSALTIEESTWLITGTDSIESHLKCIAKLKNQTSDMVAVSPGIRVTVRNQDGSIAATKEKTIRYIMPGDSSVLLRLLAVPVSLKKDMQVSIDVISSGWVPADSVDYPKSSDILISNVSEYTSGMNQSITGEITNNYSAALPVPTLIALFLKDGKIIDAEYDYLDSLNPGITLPFQLEVFQPPEHDNVELYLSE